MAQDLPVLIGAGQLVDRPNDLASALDPLTMMQRTAQAAAMDAGLGVSALAGLDAIAVVSSVGPRLVQNMPAALAGRLGAAAAERFLTVTGGNTPQSLVNQFAREIVAGRRHLVLLAGAEALDTLARAAKAGVRLGWESTEGGTQPPQTLWPDRPGSHAVEEAHGMVAPIVTYPLFENALRARLGRAAAAHQHAMGELFAPFTRIARDNRYAWFPTERSAAEISTPTPVNRYIGFPYTKYMNAVMQVNQSASVLMASESKARSLGIDPSHWVYLHGCADLHDIWHVSERIDFHSSPALELGLDQALGMAGVTAADITHFDLYSCFPVVPELTCTALGIALDDPPELTVTGGLPYFGGAGNNYSMHAIATVLQRLRGRPDERGLVTANGWYLTKHAIGVYSAGRPTATLDPPTSDLQARLNAMPHPRLDPKPNGKGCVETWTVMFDRRGQPERGLVLGRLEGGGRFVADVEPRRELLVAMTEEDPIGASGVVTWRQPTNRFTFNA